jgi:hypothetical protein
VSQYYQYSKDNENQTAEHKGRYKLRVFIFAIFLGAANVTPVVKQNTTRLSCTQIFKKSVVWVKSYKKAWRTHDYGGVSYRLPSLGNISSRPPA